MQRIIVVTTGAGGYNSIRIFEPLKVKAIRQGLWDLGIHVDVQETFTLQGLAGADHMCFHGVTFAPTLNMLRRLPCRFSCFVDDLMTAIPPWNPNQITPVQHRCLEYCMDNAASIIYSSPALIGAMGRGEKAHVQGNLEHFDTFYDWSSPRPKRALFMGGNSHAGDLELLNGLLWSGQTAVWAHCLPTAWTTAWRDPQGGLVLKPNHPQWGWVPPVPDYETYSIFRTNLTKLFGVGVAPLVDCPFNRCKSILKFLEYTACGLVSVLSDIPTFDAVPPECAVKVGPNAFVTWTDAVEWAYHHPEIGERAYEWCRENYSYEKQAHQWIDTYSFIAQHSQ